MRCELLDFELTDEQKMIQKTAQEIVDDFPLDYWYEKEEEGEFAQEYWDAMSQAGIQGIMIPEEYGGGGMGMTEMVVAVEELAKCGAGGVWYLVLTPIFGGTSILKHGSVEKKEKWLPGIANGDVEFCMALTEPDAGSNTPNIDTRAKKEGDEWVINGSKMFISGIDRADGMLLIARTTPKEEVDHPSQGISEFIVELPNDAIEYNPIPKHAVNFSKTCEVGIDDLRVPEDALLGQEGNGWYQVLSTLNPERMTGAAHGIGEGTLAIEEAVEYSNEREVFGAPIGSHQGVQFPLAEAYTRLESARMLNRKAAWMYDNDEYDMLEVGKVANTAKVVSTNAAIDATYHAMQTFGGYGFAKEYHLERMWREVNLLRLAPVTQQLALAFVGRRVLGMPRSY